MKIFFIKFCYFSATICNVCNKILSPLKYLYCLRDLPKVLFFERPSKNIYHSYIQLLAISFI